MKEPMDVVAMLLVALGGINWGLVGILNLDLVKVIFEESLGIAMIGQIVYIVVGIAALYLLYYMYKQK